MVGGGSSSAGGIGGVTLRGNRQSATRGSLFEDSHGGQLLTSHVGAKGLLGSEATLLAVGAVVAVEIARFVHCSNASGKQRQD